MAQSTKDESPDEAVVNTLDDGEGVPFGENVDSYENIIDDNSGLRYSDYSAYSSTGETAEDGEALTPPYASQSTFLMPMASITMSTTMWLK